MKNDFFSSKNSFFGEKARINDPASFDFEAAFQKSWSGEKFSNADWTKEHGGGLTQTY